MLHPGILGVGLTANTTKMKLQTTIFLCCLVSLEVKTVAVINILCCLCSLMSVRQLNYCSFMCSVPKIITMDI